MRSQRSTGGTGFNPDHLYPTAPSIYIPLEQKHCETCGRMFIRAIPTMAKWGEKNCPEHRGYVVPKVESNSRADKYNNRPKHYKVQ